MMSKLPYRACVELRAQVDKVDELVKVVGTICTGRGRDRPTRPGRAFHGRGGRRGGADAEPRDET